MLSMSYDSDRHASTRRYALDPLELDGTVSEALPNAMFRVVLADGARPAITAHIGSQSLLRVRVGDLVVIELSPYDQTRGRIVRKVSQ